MNKIRNIGGDMPTNAAQQTIREGEPYVVNVTIRGAADLLMHRYQPDAVQAKAVAAKGSKAKKSDDLESYVYRTDDGMLGMPGEYLRQAIIGAAKFRQDPRSPRKSAQDLFKAGIVPLTPIASLGVTAWDYEDARRAVVQRNAVTRVRPALRQGWTATFSIMVNLPEYIGEDLLLDVMNTAGRLIGVGDFRPTYGRFAVTSFSIA